MFFPSCSFSLVLSSSRVRSFFFFFVFSPTVRVLCFFSLLSASLLLVRLSLFLFFLGSSLVLFVSLYCSVPRCYILSAFLLSVLFSVFVLLGFSFVAGLVQAISCLKDNRSFFVEVLKGSPEGLSSLLFSVRPLFFSSFVLWLLCSLLFFVFRFFLFVLGFCVVFGSMPLFVFLVIWYFLLVPVFALSGFPPGFLLFFPPPSFFRPHFGVAILWLYKPENAMRW